MTTSNTYPLNSNAAFAPLAFQPLAKTSCLLVSTTSGRILLALSLAPQPPPGTVNFLATPNQIQVFNTNTSYIFVAFGNTNTVVASAGAAGQSMSDYPVPGNGLVVITVPPNTTYAAAIAAAGSSNVYFTPGTGAL